MYPFLSWLTPHIQSRNTISNYHISEEEKEKEEQEEDEESEEQYHEQRHKNSNNGEIQEWSHPNQHPRLLE